MKKEIIATVTYVGHDDFVDSFPSEIVMQAIKTKAMKTFELEESSADKYVLQKDGVDVNEKSHLSDWGQENATFTLILKNEVTKG